MLLTRTRLLLVAGLVAGIVAGLAPAVSGCGDHEAASPPVVPSDAHLASASPGHSHAADGATPATSGATLAASAGAARLEAVRTVELYCRLVDRGQFARAGTLCSRPGLWSRGELSSLRAFRFRSARVFAAPDPRTFVLLARVRVNAGRGCPIPDGLATLFFTLGRVDAVVGGWLITAITTSP